MVIQSQTPPKPSAAAPPTFERVPQNCRFVQGGNACFELRVKGNPRPQVKWTRRGTLLANSPKFVVQYNENTGASSLQINQLQKEDEGEYTCTATNQYGEAVCNVLIQSDAAAVPVARQYQQDVSSTFHQTRKFEQKVERTYAGTKVVDEKVTRQTTYDAKSTPMYYTNGTDESFKVDTFEYRLLREIDFRATKTKRLAGETETETDTETKEKAAGPTSPPQLLQRLRNSKLLEGSDVTFQAKISGNPNPRLTWFKNGQRVFTSQRIKITYKDQTATLSIHMALPEDAGHYTLLAENSVGTIACSAQLVIEAIGTQDELQFSQRYEQLDGIAVQQKTLGYAAAPEPVDGDAASKSLRPNFAKVPTDKEVTEGKMVRLDCRVTGRPYPEVFWYLNGKQILDDGTHKLIVNEAGNHSLLITIAQRTDAGTYTCIAKNKGGEASFQLNLIVIEKEQVVAPKFVERFQTVHVREGEPISLHCRAVGTPVPRMTWQKDGIQIHSTPDCVINTEGGSSSLNISTTKLSDSAWYQCTAQNMAGSTATRARLYVEVEQLPIPEPWRLSLPRPTRVIQPEGSPEREVIWLRHVERAQHYQSHPEEEPRITTKPMFTHPLKNLPPIEEGGRAQFEARLIPIGDPSMQVEWYFNGKPLPASSRFMTSYRFGYVSLTILYVYAHDHGVYTCRAVNDLGEDITQATLTVTARTRVEYSSQHPESMEHIYRLEEYERYKRRISVEEASLKPVFVEPLRNLPNLQEGQYAHLEAKVTPLSDPYLKIEWYFNNKQLTASSRITTIYSFGYVALNIMHLRIEDSGNYSCKAINRAGEAISTAKVTITVRTSGVVSDTGVEEQRRYIEKTEELEAYQKTTRRDYAEEQVVKKKPEFKTKIKDQTNVMEGQSAHFEAVLEPVGDPNLKVEWTKNGKPLEASSRITTFFNFGYVALTIKAVNEHDAGNYVCTATNKLGSDTTRAFLTIIVKSNIDVDSQHPQGLERIRYIEDSSRYAREMVEETITKQLPRFTVALQGNNKLTEGQAAHFEARLEPVNDPNMKVEWFLNGKPLQSAHRYKTYFDFGYVALDILYVFPEDTGLYTVKATNSVGYATQTAELTVKAKVSVDTATIHKLGLEKIQHLEDTQYYYPHYEIEEYTKTKPKFVVPLKDLPPLRESDHIHLECRLEPIGDPTLRVEWFFNGRPLTIGSRFKPLFDFGYVALDISGASSDDSGEYTVRATNHLGTAHTSSCVTVIGLQSIIYESQHPEGLDAIHALEDFTRYQRPHHEDAPINQMPTYTKPLRNIETVEGSDIHLETRLKPVGDPTMNIEWRVNGKPVPTGHRFRPAYDFDYVALDIVGSYPEDSGVYSCHAVNKMGTAVTSATVKVIAKKAIILESQHPEGLEQIQYLEDSSRHQRDMWTEEIVKVHPRFLTKFKNLENLREGQNAHFECRLEPVTDPNLKVEWFKNSRSLTIGHRFRPIHDFGYVALDILGVVEEDTGVYTCRASNMVGSEEMSVKLTVKGPKSLRPEQQSHGITVPLEPFPVPEFLETKEEPRPPIFESELCNVTVKEGQSVVLECYVSGYPKPEITWYINSKEIKPTQGIRIRYKKNKASLHISQVFMDDRGEYICKATNKLGTRISRAFLYVEELTEEETTKRSTTVAELVTTEKRLSEGPKPEVEQIRDTEDSFTLTRSKDISIESRRIGKKPTATTTKELPVDRRVKARRIISKKIKESQEREFISQSEDEDNEDVPFEKSSDEYELAELEPTPDTEYDESSSIMRVRRDQEVTITSKGKPRPTVSQKDIWCPTDEISQKELLPKQKTTKEFEISTKGPKPRFPTGEEPKPKLDEKPKVEHWPVDKQALGPVKHVPVKYIPLLSKPEVEDSEIIESKKMSHEMLLWKQSPEENTISVRDWPKEEWPIHPDVSQQEVTITSNIVERTKKAFTMEVTQETEQRKRSTREIQFMHRTKAPQPVPKELETSPQELKPAPQPEKLEPMPGALINVTDQVKPGEFPQIVRPLKPTQLIPGKERVDEQVSSVSSTEVTMQMRQEKKAELIISRQLPEKCPQEVKKEITVVSTKKESLLLKPDRSPTRTTTKEITLKEEITPKVEIESKELQPKPEISKIEIMAPFKPSAKIDKPEKTMQEMPMKVIEEAKPDEMPLTKLVTEMLPELFPTHLHDTQSVTEEHVSKLTTETIEFRKEFEMIPKPSIREDKPTVDSKTSQILITKKVRKDFMSKTDIGVQPLEKVDDLQPSPTEVLPLVEEKPTVQKGVPWRKPKEELKEETVQKLVPLAEQPKPLVTELQETIPVAFQPGPQTIEETHSVISKQTMSLMQGELVEQPVKEPDDTKKPTEKLSIEFAKRRIGKVISKQMMQEEPDTELKEKTVEILDSVTTERVEHEEAPDVEQTSALITSTFEPKTKVITVETIERRPYFDERKPLDKDQQVVIESRVVKPFTTEKDKHPLHTAEKFIYPIQKTVKDVDRSIKEETVEVTEERYTTKEVTMRSLDEFQLHKYVQPSTLEITFEGPSPIDSEAVQTIVDQPLLQPIQKWPDDKQQTITIDTKVTRTFITERGTQPTEMTEREFRPTEITTKDIQFTEVQKLQGPEEIIKPLAETKPVEIETKQTPWRKVEVPVKVKPGEVEEQPDSKVTATKLEIKKTKKKKELIPTEKPDVPVPLEWPEEKEQTITIDTKVKRTFIIEKETKPSEIVEKVIRPKEIAIKEIKFTKDVVEQLIGPEEIEKPLAEVKPEVLEIKEIPWQEPELIVQGKPDQSTEPESHITTSTIDIKKSKKKKDQVHIQRVEDVEVESKWPEDKQQTITIDTKLTRTFITEKETEPIEVTKREIRPKELSTKEIKFSKTVQEFQGPEKLLERLGDIIPEQVTIKEIPSKLPIKEKPEVVEQPQGPTTVIKFTEVVELKGPEEIAKSLEEVKPKQIEVKEIPWRKMEIPVKEMPEVVEEKSVSKVTTTEMEIKKPKKKKDLVPTEKPKDVPVQVKWPEEKEQTIIIDTKVKRTFITERETKPTEITEKVIKPKETTTNEIKFTKEVIEKVTHPEQIEQPYEEDKPEILEIKEIPWRKTEVPVKEKPEEVTERPESLIATSGLDIKTTRKKTKRVHIQRPEGMDVEFEWPEGKEETITIDTKVIKTFRTEKETKPTEVTEHVIKPLETTTKEIKFTEEVIEEVTHPEDILKPHEKVKPEVLEIKEIPWRKTVVPVEEKPEEVTEQPESLIATSGLDIKKTRKKTKRAHIQRPEGVDVEFKWPEEKEQTITIDTKVIKTYITEKETKPTEIAEKVIKPKETTTKEIKFTEVIEEVAHSEETEKPLKVKAEVLEIKEIPWRKTELPVEEKPEEVPEQPQSQITSSKLDIRKTTKKTERVHIQKPEDVDVDLMWPQEKEQTITIDTIVTKAFKTEKETLPIKITEKEILPIERTTGEIKFTEFVEESKLPVEIVKPLEEIVPEQVEVKEIPWRKTKILVQEKPEILEEKPDSQAMIKLDIKKTKKQIVPIEQQPEDVPVQLKYPEEIERTVTIDTKVMKTFLTEKDTRPVQITEEVVEPKETTTKEIQLTKVVEELKVPEDIEKPLEEQPLTMVTEKKPKKKQKVKTTVKQLEVLEMPTVTEEIVIVEETITKLEEEISKEMDTKELPTKPDKHPLIEIRELIKKKPKKPRKVKMETEEIVTEETLFKPAVETIEEISWTKEEKLDVKPEEQPLPERSTTELVMSKKPKKISKDRTRVEIQPTTEEHLQVVTVDSKVTKKFLTEQELKPIEVSEAEIPGKMKTTQDVISMEELKPVTLPEIEKKDDTKVSQAPWRKGPKPVKSVEEKGGEEVTITKTTVIMKEGPVEEEVEQVIKEISQQKFPEQDIGVTSRKKVTKKVEKVIQPKFTEEVISHQKRISPVQAVELHRREIEELPEEFLPGQVPDLVTATRTVSTRESYSVSETYSQGYPQDFAPGEVPYRSAIAEMQVASQQRQEVTVSEVRTEGSTEEFVVEQVRHHQARMTVDSRDSLDVAQTQPIMEPEEFEGQFKPVHKYATSIVDSKESIQMEVVTPEDSVSKVVEVIPAKGTAKETFDERTLLVRTAASEVLLQDSPPRSTDFPNDTDKTSIRSSAAMPSQSQRDKISSSVYGHPSSNNQTDLVDDNDWLKLNVSTVFMIVFILQVMAWLVSYVFASIFSDHL